MRKIDEFAQIAFNDSNKNKKELSEVNPIDFKSVYFKPSNKKAEYIKEKTYEEKLTEFNKQLNNLKKEYKKFLVDNSSKLHIKRK